MFKIYADDIEYDGRPFARFLPNLQPSFRGSAEAALELAEPDPVSREDHEREIKDLEDENARIVEALETERDEAIERAEQAERDLDHLSEGLKLADLLVDLRRQVDTAQASALQWRKAYETLKCEADKPKRRRR